MQTKSGKRGAMGIIRAGVGYFHEFHERLVEDHGQIY